MTRRQRWSRSGDTPRSAVSQESQRSRVYKSGLWLQSRRLPLAFKRPFRSWPRAAWTGSPSSVDPGMSPRDMSRRHLTSPRLSDVWALSCFAAMGVQTSLCTRCRSTPCAAPLCVRRGVDPPVRLCCGSRGCRLCRAGVHITRGAPRAVAPTLVVHEALPRTHSHWTRAPWTNRALSARSILLRLTPSPSIWRTKS